MSESQYKAVVVGASAGGVVAISSLLECLPSNFLTPICIVLHLPPDKNSMLDQIFNARYRLKKLMIKRVYSLDLFILHHQIIT